MNIVFETKACEACTKAKRKCGKEQPRCHRCSSRGLDCVYTPARPTSFVLLQDDPAEPESPSATAVPLGNADAALWDPDLLLCNLSQSEPALAVSADSPFLSLTTLSSTPPKHLCCDWFLSPETWRSASTLHDNIRAQSPPSTPYKNSFLRRSLPNTLIQLTAWVSTGRCTFIHKELYTLRSPRCVQDAYAIMALYMAKTDDNEDVVFRSIEDRGRDLVREDKGSVDTAFNQLAKVHALFTYVVIGICDGDIHLRSVADSWICILERWVEEMVDSVRNATALDQARTDLGLGLSQLAREEMVWSTWVFAESLRRTWIAVHGVLTMYHFLQKGWASCPGSMRITAGEGLWDAPSSYAWSSKCARGNIHFIEGTDTESLFVEARPEEVDEFTRSCMEITYGTARMERWGK